MGEGLEPGYWILVFECEAESLSGYLSYTLVVSSIEVNGLTQTSPGRWCYITS